MTRLYVDSCARVAGTATNFAIDLAEDIVVAEETYATIGKLLIPTSWYLISEHNNRFYFMEQSGTTLLRRIIYQEPSNYDIAHLTS